MRARVLLADDHALVRDGLRVLLEAQGEFTVIAEAADGEEAVRLACRLHPDLAVLDLAMPHLNGIDAVARIGDRCPTVRCVVLSMHASSEHVYRAVRAGARGYLLKESLGRTVTQALRAVTGGRRYLDPALPRALRQQLERTDLPAKTPLERLTPRERRILQLVAEGNSSARIGELLQLSPKTIDTYRSRLMAKLDLRDVPSLVKFAVEHGLTPLSQKNPLPQ